MELNISSNVPCQRLGMEMRASLIQGHRYMQVRLSPVQTVLVPHDYLLERMTLSKHFSSTGKHPNWQPKQNYEKSKEKLKCIAQQCGYH